MAGTEGRWPALSVIMPVRNDASHLPDAVAAVLAQDYPGERELVLAVAPSSDGTEEVAARLAREHDALRVVPNPAGSTPAALNIAIAASTGEVVARVDSHAEPADSYLRRAVELLRTTGADNVGGIQRAKGVTPFQRAVAAAMSSRFGTGDARFHYGGDAGPIETVYLGVFRRSALERVGGFDETLERNQDYELNHRIRATGGVVYFHPDLEVVYRPRATWRALASQYFQYGRWKREVLRRHPGSVRWRQLVPPAAVLANVAGLTVGGVWRPALAIPLVYAAATLVASALARADWSARLRLPVVFATMHHAWGLGFVLGPPGKGAHAGPADDALSE